MAGTSVSTESFAREKKAAYKGPRLRMAIIGCGGVSEIQLKALQTMPDVEIVAGADINPQRLQSTKDKFALTALYTDYHKMLKEIKPDAVTVCTPNAVHAPATIAALKAGAHVITEKPMAMSPEECQSMIDAANKANRKLAVGFQYRFHPATQMLRRARDEGQFGKVMFVKCQALRRRGIPNWGVFGQKHLQGGGPMIDIGVHVIEMAHYVMGSPKPVAATGKTWTYMGNKPNDVSSMWPDWDWKTYTVEDLAIGHIRFDNGAVIQIEACFAGHIERDVWNFTLAGEKGGCTWDPPAIFTDRAGTMTHTTPAYLAEGDFFTLFKLKLQNFVDGVLRDQPLEAPGEAGAAVQKIVDGVYRSSEAGKEVRIG